MLILNQIKKNATGFHDKFWKDFIDFYLIYTDKILQKNESFYFSHFVYQAHGILS